MDTVRSYLISVISVAIIVSIATSLIKDKNTISAGIKILSGLILSITIIKPLLSQQLFDITRYINDINISAETYIDNGKTNANVQRQELIKDRVEAYIFDKATALGVELDVNVSLSEDDNVPVSVSLIGSVSPYTKSSLCKFIEQELGIPKENQKWS